MPLVNVKVIAGVSSAEQEREMTSDVLALHGRTPVGACG